MICLLKKVSYNIFILIFNYVKSTKSYFNISIAAYCHRKNASNLIQKIIIYKYNLRINYNNNN